MGYVVIYIDSCGSRVESNFFGLSIAISVINYTSSNNYNENGLQLHMVQLDIREI